jgi:ABC-type Na+ efflux pump permease subunit
MRAILSIARKDLRLLFRDKGDVFFTFVFPMLMAVLFGFVFGGGGGGSKIKLALVNESDARIAVDLAADLANDGAFEVTRLDTRDEAIAAVRAGKATAVVVLPERASRIVTRELLYTGVTRASEKVTIVGSRRVIEAAITKPIRRATGLQARLG